MRLVLFTASHAMERDFSKVYSGFSEPQREQLAASIFHTGNKLEGRELERMLEAVQSADFIIHDAHGAESSTLHKIVRACSEAKQAYQVPVGGNQQPVSGLLCLGKLRAEDLSGDQTSRTSRTSQHKDRVPPFSNTPAAGAAESGKQRDAQAFRRIQDYWQGSGPHNLRHLLIYLMHEYGGDAELWPNPAMPVLLDGLELFDAASSRSFGSLEHYWSSLGADPSRPTVAVLFMGHTYPLETHPVVASFTAKLRAEANANVLQIALASITGVDIRRLGELLRNGGAGGSKVDFIVNFIPFRLGAGPVGGDSSAVLELLEELGAPLAHPFFLTRKRRAEWEASLEGLSSSEFMVQMLLPELDGATLSLPVASMEEEGGDPELKLKWNGLSLIEDRAERTVSWISRWLTLQTKSRSDKKIALIGYNYPPGEGNLFGGSFLDTLESISRLLAVLAKEGYDVEEMTAAQIRDKMLGEGLVNSASWSGAGAVSNLIRYSAAGYPGSANPARNEAMIRRWGRPPGEMMAESNGFLIPGFVNGKVFIGLQPTRGVHEDPAKSYHDKSQLPPHQYLAFYRYLREQFGADAYLHIGTHGTLEFMEGKEAGMSQACLPDELIADVPHFYYYYMGNPSEAMIAKRRSHAVLISYQSPPFIEGELYGELLQLDELLHAYRQAKQLSPHQCADIASKIRASAGVLHLDGDNLEEIEAEVYRERRSLIPQGLHVLGGSFRPDDAADFVKFALRHDRKEARSLAALLAAGRGLDYGELLKHEQTEVLKELDAEASRLVEAFVRSGNVPELASESEELQKQWRQTWNFGKDVYSRATSNQELEQLICALDGKYVPVRLAGDIVRNPEILPSGYNLVQFDPRSVPGDTAVERGAAIAENTIELYKKEHGSCPSTIAVVMWGLETSRTQGETFGQILSYLGVRIAGRNRLNQPIYEIIPLQELGRPRLNVVINICGFFRDMFPNLLEELNQLFKQVAELDETDADNAFKKHADLLYRQLLGEGFAEADARDLACARIFGPAEGEYGARVNKLVETKAWSEEAELGKSYMDSLKYVYSGNSRGRDVARLFDANLKAVEIVSQIRSNHEHEVTDLDHYYEYFGGLAKSVELAKGSRAEIFISDTTSEKVLTEDVARSIHRGLRTRLLNPKWIDALLEHSYHGAQKIAQRFENMLGLAATTNKVDSWVFSALHDAYVADEKRSKQLEANNRWAYHHMLETLLECHQRSYWNASEEELQQLSGRFMELEGELEEMK